jgi:hypothetical protein
VHLKKNPETEKLDGNLLIIKFPIDYRRVFFRLRFFFGVHFYEQTPGTDLHHTVLLVGVTDPAFLEHGWGEVLFYLNLYVNIHIFKWPYLPQKFSMNLVL